MNALDLCLDNTYLCFCKTFYRQIFGVAMGSPISVIVANLFMESIENKMLKNFASPPRIWLRYIDDTFVVLKKTEVAFFHKFINNVTVNGAEVADYRKVKCRSTRFRLRKIKRK